MKKSLFSFPVKHIKFQERPNAIDANYRLIWKLPFIIWLIFKLSGKHSVSLKRLSLFNWALQSADLFYLLDEILVYENRIATVSIKHEPTLSRSLLYLKAMELIEIKNGKYKLTTIGRQAALEIDQQDGIFILEKEQIGKYQKNQISEVRVTKLLLGK